MYLFQFICDQTNEAFTFIAEDISAYTDRYNEFVIIEKTSPDNLQGEVRLAIEGQYSYKVWEQVSATNLVAPNTTPLETGMVVVSGTPDTTNTYTFNPTHKVYNP